MGYVSHKSEESMEDYLETIYVLRKRLPVVRSIDIATELGYSKPSVSVAMKNLKPGDLLLFPRKVIFPLRNRVKRLQQKPLSGTPLSGTGS